MNYLEIIFYMIIGLMVISSLCLKPYTVYIMRNTGYNPQNSLNRYISMFTSVVITIGMFGTPSLLIMVIPAIALLTYFNSKHMVLKHAVLFSIIHFASSLAIISVKLVIVVIGLSIVLATGASIVRLDPYNPFSPPIYVRDFSSNVNHAKEEERIQRIRDNYNYY